MKYPSSLKVGGHEYKVQFHNEGEVCADSANCGVTVRTKGLFEINSSLIRTEQEATLLHEIFHVLNSTLDHELLDSITQQLYQVLKDNRFCFDDEHGAANGP